MIFFCQHWTEEKFEAIFQDDDHDLYKRTDKQFKNDHKLCDVDMGRRSKFIRKSIFIATNGKNDGQRRILG